MRSIAREHKERNLRAKYKVPDNASLNDALELPRLSQEICNTIAGKHNQDVRMLTVGRQGSGKSMFDLYLCYQVACRLAEKKGGEWEDYFDIDHVAVAKTEDILELFGNMKQYHVYLADDIGMSWGARDFSKKINKFLNIIFQLMRTRNNFLSVSIISNFLLDKVPRSLMNFEINMDMSLFDYGMVVPKVFNVVQKPRQNKPFTVYPRFGNVKVVRYLGYLPPEDLVKEYNKRREAVEIEVRTEKIAELLEGEKNSIKVRTPNEQIYEDIHIIEQDPNIDVSTSKLCKALGVSHSAYIGYRDRNF